MTNQAKSVIGMYELINFLCEIDDDLMTDDPFESTPEPLKESDPRVFKKIEAKKKKLRANIETLKFIIKAVYLICKCPKMKGKDDILEGIQEALLNVLTSKHVLRYLNLLDKYYVLMSIKFIHRHSDQNAQKFALDKSYRILFKILTKGIDSFAQETPML